MNITVIIPTYKRSVLLERAIKSSLAELCEDDEIVVVNNNGCLDFEHYIDELKNRLNDTRIKFLKAEKLANGAHARNFGAQNARNDMLCFLDDDDYFTPGKIDKIKELHNENHNIIINRNIKIYNNKFFYCNLPSTNKDLLFRTAAEAIQFNTSSLSVNRIFFNTYLRFDENLTRNQDVELFMRIFSRFPKEVHFERNIFTAIDVSDGQNRPDFIQYCSIKRILIQKLSDDINYTSALVKKVTTYVKLELLIRAITSGEIAYLLKNFLDIRYLFSLANLKTLGIKIVWAIRQKLA